MPAGSVATVTMMFAGVVTTQMPFVQFSEALPWQIQYCPVRALKRMGSLRRQAPPGSDCTVTTGVAT